MFVEYKMVLENGSLKTPDPIKNGGFLPLNNSFIGYWWDYSIYIPETLIVVDKDYMLDRVKNINDDQFTAFGEQDYINYINEFIDFSFSRCEIYELEETKQRFLKYVSKLYYSKIKKYGTVEVTLPNGSLISVNNLEQSERIYKSLLDIMGDSDIKIIRLADNSFYEASKQDIQLIWESIVNKIDFFFSMKWELENKIMISSSKEDIFSLFKFN